MVRAAASVATIKERARKGDIVARSLPFRFSLFGAFFSEPHTGLLHHNSGNTPRRVCKKFFKARSL